MPNKKVTDLTEVTTPADGDLVYIVDVSDTTDSAAGSSRYVQASNLRGWPQTSAESTAGVTPTNLQYPPGSVLRYGTNTTPGTTDMTTAIQAAIDQQNQGGPSVCLGGGVFSYATTLTVYSGTSIVGLNPTETQLKYTGSAQGFKQSTAGTRIFDLVFRNFYLNDAGTGTIGFDMDSVSTSMFDDIHVNGFATGFKFNSPTSGYSVYNRLYKCYAQNATTGFHITGTSSNANTLTGCRADSTDSVIIDDSNDNALIHCQFESGVDGVVLTSTSPGLNDATKILFCRFESNSGNDLDIGTDVRDTMIVGCYGAGGWTISDSGTRTRFLSSTGATTNDFYTSQDSDGFFNVTRDVAVTGNNALVKLSDTNTGSGVPTTLEINTDRGAGHAVRVMKSGVEAFGVTGNGLIRTNQDAPNTNTPAGATAHQIPIYNESGTLLGYIPVYGSAW